MKEIDPEAVEFWSAIALMVAAFLIVAAIGA